MNYIKQINAFWEKEKTLALDTQIQSYYFAMLFFANKYGFEFSLYREDVMEQAKLAKNTYYKVRSQAKELGLVDFIEGESKRTKCHFKLINLYQNCDKKEDKPCDIEKDKACDHTDKLINNETTNTTPAGENSEIITTETSSKPKLTNFQMFLKCHEIYPGTTLEPETDFSVLEARFKNEFNTDFFRKIYLGICNKIKEDKALAKQRNAFIPKWPYFKNYLADRKWELHAKPQPKEEPFKEPKAFNNTDEHYAYWGGVPKPEAA